MPAAWDVIVVGGGPAGSTVASILLRHRPETRVLVLERAAFPRFHVGESLVPEVNRILHEMGAYEKMERAGFVRKYGATFRWGLQREPWTTLFGEMEALRPLHERFGPVQTLYTWHVDRARYDHLLLDHAASLGAEVRQGAAVSGLIESAGRVQGVVTAQGEEFRARYIVDATGQAGLSGSLADREMDPRLRHVACWGYWRGFHFDPRYTGMLDSTRAFIVAHANGWSWFFPIREDLVSVGVVTSLEAYRDRMRKDPEGFYRQALASSPELRHLLREARLERYREDLPFVHCLSDFSYFSRSLTRPGFARVGDAAGFVDPILSVGCFLGQFFGRVLAYGLSTLLRGDDRLSEEVVWEAYGSHLQDALQAYRQITYFFYRFSGRPEDWWAEARRLVETAGFPRAATDRQAFNLFVTGFAARRGFFRESTAVFDEPFFEEALRQLVSPQSPSGPAKTLPGARHIFRLRGEPMLRPSAVPLEAQGRMAPALRVEIHPEGACPEQRFLRRLYVPPSFAPLFQLVDGRRSVRQLGESLLDRIGAGPAHRAYVARYTQMILAGLWERGLAEAVAAEGAAESRRGGEYSRAS